MKTPPQLSPWSHPIRFVRASARWGAYHLWPDGFYRLVAPDKPMTFFRRCRLAFFPTARELGSIYYDHSEGKPPVKLPGLIIQSHVEEQFEALARDIKSGAAFDKPHWKVEPDPPLWKMREPTPFWKFWSPHSGLPGGCLAALILWAIILLIRWAIQ